MAVYFVQCGESNLIKIGSSKQPFIRIRGLQTGCPGSLATLKIVKGGPDFEHSLHERFAKDRARGEWFRPSPELLAEIEKIPQLVMVEDNASVHCRTQRPLQPYLDRVQNHPVVKAIMTSDETYGGIAKAHGVSKQRVQQIAARLEREKVEFPKRPRGPKKNDPDEALEIIESLTQSADSYEIIAWQCGVPVSRVEKIAGRLRKEGVSIPPRRQIKPKNPRRQSIERDIIESSAPFGEIAAKHGVTVGLISHFGKALRDAGVKFVERPRFGYSPRDRTDEDIKRQLIERDIVSSLMTFAEIAANHKCCANLVGRIAKGLREQGVDFVERRAFRHPGQLSHTKTARRSKSRRKHVDGQRQFSFDS